MKTFQFYAVSKTCEALADGFWLAPDASTARKDIAKRFGTTPGKVAVIRSAIEKSGVYLMGQS